MEFISLSSPITILIAAILFLIIVWQIISDMREVTRTKRLNRQLMEMGKKQSLQTFSIIIELKESAETIFPLLDAIYAEEYKKLEIIIVIKHTAGKYAQAKLQQYQAGHKRKNMHLVMHRRGVTTLQIIKKHTTKKYILLLAKNEQLSKGFFTYASLELLSDPDAITLRCFSSLNSTLQSGMAAYVTIWSNLFIKGKKTIHTAEPLQRHMVYKRTSLIKVKSNTLQVTSSHQPVYIFSSIPLLLTRKYIVNMINEMTSRRSYRLLSILVSVATMASVASLVILPPDFALLAAVIFFAYAFIYISTVITIKGYSAIDKINLFLFAPVGLIFIIFLSIVSLYRQIVLAIGSSYKAATKLYNHAR